MVLPHTVAHAQTASSKPKPTAPSTKGYDEHKVKRGETLWGIAQSYGKSVGEVMDFNGMKGPVVKDGMLLKIPHAKAPEPEKAPQRVHIVHQGETFWTIADDYKITAEILAKANPTVNPNRVHEDMELNIPDSATIPDKKSDQVEDDREIVTTSPATDSTIHVVAAKETFYSIGKKYGVSTDAMVKANPTIKPERLREGMKVVIPGKNVAKPAESKPAQTKPIDKTTKPTETVKRTPSSKAQLHTVKKGETIAAIAAEYGVSEQSIIKQNRITPRDTIKSGDVLVIPGSANVAAQTSSKPPVKESAKPATTPAPSKPVTKDVSKPVASSAKPLKVSTTVKDPYIVSAGEDENTICAAFGITKQKLYELNGLSMSTKLRAGDEIMLPAKDKK